MSEETARSQPEQATVLSVESVSKTFPIRKGLWKREVGAVRAVDGASLEVSRGETLGIVGESGSGKTTLARIIVRAHEATEGAVSIRDHRGRMVDITAADGRELKEARRSFHMIFQDPHSSLNPRMTVEEIVSEPLIHNLGVSRSEARERVIETLRLVGLGEEHLHRFANAFSGGQRQRIGIARSLVCSPSLLVCDEPVSALDVSIQAQILNLLRDLQEQLSLSYLFISHDLAVVEHLAHRVAVMYVGQIVEVGDTRDIFAAPKHPYTEALLSSTPMPESARERPRIVLRGEVANPADPPSGCYFHPRCPYATELCAAEAPPLRPVGDRGQQAACHYAEELSLGGTSTTSKVS